MFAYVFEPDAPQGRRAAAAGAVPRGRAVLRRPAGGGACSRPARSRALSSACGFGGFAYLTDCSGIPETVLASARGSRRGRARRAARASAPDAFLARRGDRRRAADWRRAGPISRTCATTCRTRATCAKLPAGFELAYDGLRVQLLNMNIAHYPDDPIVKWNQPVLALGNFDGLHRGHMKIIDRVRRRAGERGGTPAAMTFDPHPPRIVRPDKAPPLLMTKEQKLEALGRSGMQGVAVVAVHRRDVEVGAGDLRPYRPRRVAPRRRGVGRSELPVRPRPRLATTRCCARLGARYGFRAEKIDPVRYKDFVVSSTRIRRLIAEGRVDEAGALLGHHYFIDGTVVRGAGRGRRDRGSHGEPADDQRAARRRLASTRRQ